MDPITVVLIILLIGAIIAALIGIFVSSGTSRTIDELEEEFDETRQQTKQVRETNAVLAGEVEKLKSKRWCDENRPKMLDLKEFR